jgi:hypothetical protein
VVGELNLTLENFPEGHSQSKLPLNEDGRSDQNPVVGVFSPAVSLKLPENHSGFWECPSLNYDFALSGLMDTSWVSGCQDGDIWVEGRLM